MCPRRRSILSSSCLFRTVCAILVMCLVVSHIAAAATPSGSNEGVQLCARGHIFLLVNETFGVTLFYTNTHLSRAENVTIDEHYLPPLSICGNRSGRCGMSLVNSPDWNILVIVFPLNSGLGLISFQSDNGSFCLREKRFLAQNLVDGCTFVFFAPFSSRTHLIGYCLDITNQMLHSIFVQIRSFESLDSSRISQNDAYGAFDIQNNLYLSNFLFFPNTDFCFSNENGHTIFVRSSDVIDHSFDDIEYYVHGSIDVPSCSTSEPRLQQLKSECKVGVYCDSTTTLLDSPEQFSGSGGIVARLATGTDEQAFLCSSEYFVHFRNKTLSIRDVTNRNQVGSSLPFNAEGRIIFGDCLISESNFYFVSTFSNSKTVFFDFNNLSSFSLGEHEENTTSVPYLVQNELLFINNRTNTLVYNWTRMCEEDILTLPVTFDLALSFVDERTTEGCGCVPELTTTGTSSDLSSTTDRNVVRPTTSDSSNSGLTTNTMGSSQDIDESLFFGIAFRAAALVMVIPLSLIIILTVVIIVVCGICIHINRKTTKSTSERRGIDGGGHSEVETPAQDEAETPTQDEVGTHAQDEADIKNDISNTKKYEAKNPLYCEESKSLSALPSKSSDTENSSQV